MCQVLQTTVPSPGRDDSADFVCDIDNSYSKVSDEISQLSSVRADESTLA
ncbi:hypothetical protein AGR7B_Lc100015 [Agrobacterium deltaense RV3]|nr:hypothetical protein AGR7B_Lc100015 [Agrobacterium deltaense RV3]